MKKRILFILNNLQIGGVQKFVLDIYRNIDKKEFDIYFAVENTDRLDNFPPEIDAKLTVFKLPNHLRCLRYRSCLKKLIRELKIDTVHINMNFLSFLPLSCCGKDVHKIVHAHATYPASSFFSKVGRFFISKYIFKKADTRLACSHEAGIWLYRSRDFIFVPNGIDEERYKFSIVNREKVRETLAIGQNVPILLFVGKLSAVKRCLFLIEAFNNLSKINDNAILLVAGDGELKEQIIEKIDEYNLKNKVYLLGNVDNVPELLSCADCLVIPSIYEGFPYAALEGSANGIPIVIHNKMPFKNTFFPNLIETNAEDMDVFVDTLAYSLNKKRVKFSLGDFALKNTIGKISHIYKNGKE